ncbi:MAG: PPOX class F420-dependent oxidoreductase [Phototrophicales bacterium]|nr:MAG: PPOX class F420-dependent oxidoreductase [Phototrophicales bacterium]RMG76015.1 MAG: PPOX class F420-dependent oxidoreductase [Chloroflexota bacterium]
MIPEDKHDLLERPIVAALATVMPDTQPQVTPVWFSYDGTHIWVNTARGRQKDINMKERPRATLLIIDPENPYRYLEIRGIIDEVTEEGGVEHINALSKRYFGRDDYYATMPERRGKETRVIYKIRPTHAS